jgi:hypothetical protein
MICSEASFDRLDMTASSWENAIFDDLILRSPQQTGRHRCQRWRTSNLIGRLIQVRADLFSMAMSSSAPA